MRWSKDFLDSLTERDRTGYELAVEHWRETWQGLLLPRARIYSSRTSKRSRSMWNDLGEGLRRWRGKASVALVLVAAVGPVAAESAPYAYGGVGYGHLLAEPNDERRVLDHDVELEVPFGQDTLSAFAGYRFGPHWAAEVELGYGPQRTATLRIDRRTHTASLRYWTVTASGLVLLPVDAATDIYARAGLTRWQVTLGRKDRPQRKDGVGVTLGVGAQVHAWSRSSVGVELRTSAFDKNEVGVEWAKTLMVRWMFH